MGMLIKYESVGDKMNTMIEKEIQQFKNTENDRVTPKMLEEYFRYNRKLNLLGGFDEQRNMQQAECRLRINADKQIVEEIRLIRLQIAGREYELPQYITSLECLSKIDVVGQPKYLKITHYNNKIEDMQALFSVFKGVKTLDLQDFDFTGVHRVDDLFYGSSMRHIIFGGNTTLKPSEAEGMFCNCSNLNQIDLRNVDLSHCGRMKNMFADDRSLVSVKFNTDIVYECVTLGRDFSFMFSGCDSLKETNLGLCDIPDIVKQDFMFNRCYSLEEIDLSHLHSGYMMSNRTYFRKLNASGLFQDCTMLRKVTLGELARNGVEFAQDMFNGCEKLEDVDTYNIISDNSCLKLSSMFSGCQKLKEVDLSGLADAQLVDIHNMFCGCKSLEKVKIRAKIDNLQELGGAFYDCYNLVDLDIHDEQNYTPTIYRKYDIQNMYSDCYKLKKAELFNFRAMPNYRAEQPLSRCKELEFVSIPYLSIGALVRDAKKGIKQQFRSLYFQLYELYSKYSLREIQLMDDVYKLDKGSKLGSILEKIYNYKIDEIEDFKDWT